MTEIVLVIHLLIALALIGTVLLQRSEGGALGIGGGGGAGGGMFTARGAGNALTRSTAILAVCFFITSISLTVLATRSSAPDSVFKGVAGSKDAGDKKAIPGTGFKLPNLGDKPDPTKPQVPVN